MRNRMKKERMGGTSIVTKITVISVGGMLFFCFNSIFSNLSFLFKVKVSSSTIVKGHVIGHGEVRSENKKPDAVLVPFLSPFLLKDETNSKEIL